MDRRSFFSALLGVPLAAVGAKAVSKEDAYSLALSGWRTKAKAEAAAVMEPPELLRYVTEYLNAMTNAWKELQARGHQLSEDRKAAMNRTLPVALL